MSYELVEVLEKFKHEENAYALFKSEAGKLRRRGLTSILSVKMYRRNGLWRVCLYRNKH